MDTDELNYARLGGLTLLVMLCQWSAFLILTLCAIAAVVVFWHFFFQRDLLSVLSVVTGPGLLVLAVVLLFTWLVAWLEYRHYAIKLDQSGVHIRRGLLAVNANSLSYRRIRDVVVSRSLFERVIGVSTIFINLIGDSDQTSSAYQATIVLPAIPRRLADHIHKLLTERVSSTPPIA
jgi:uncharacterized membrane protein YdbT with pleckstrin-like domain